MNVLKYTFETISKRKLIKEMNNNKNSLDFNKEDIFNHEKGNFYFQIIIIINKKNLIKYHHHWKVMI